MPQRSLLDILQAAGVSFDLADTKIHLATHNQREDPRDVYASGRFRAWQERQGRMNFECDKIISLIKLPGRDRWMFAGVYSVHGHRDPSVPGNYHYRTRIVPASASLSGQLIVVFKRPGKQAYMWAEGYARKLLVADSGVIATPVQPASAASRGAYKIARRVFLSRLSRSEGIALIHRRYGMNPGSAGIHLYVYARLRRGEEPRRGLSVADFAYYLERIEAEDGTLALQVAVHSLWQHIAYYENVRKTPRPALRALASQYGPAALSYSTLEQNDREFAKKVAAARKRSPEERRKRLAAARKMPARRPVVIVGFVRNEDVVAEVLDRARGHCEGCRKPAPFVRRKDRSPYLEVHHIVQLSQGGEDTVKNSMAMCPNCHRHAHFG